MKIIAHRGASGYAPENTLAAIKLATKQKADMIEFDVHALPTGEVILMHDHLVNRTTNGRGYIVERPFADLRALDAGGRETVPTLQEALEAIDRRAVANIELKGFDSAAGTAKILKHYLAKGWEPGDFLVSSFNHHELVRFRRLLPQVDILALMDAIPLDYAAYAEELGAVGIGPGHESVNAAYVRDAHRRGLRVYVWGARYPEELVRLYQMGVDGIFTDFPDAARKAAETFQMASL